MYCLSVSFSQVRCGKEYTFVLPKIFTLPIAEAVLSSLNVNDPEPDARNHIDAEPCHVPVIWSSAAAGKIRHDAARRTTVSMSIF